MSTSNKTKKQIGSKTTEIIIGTAASKLTAATKALAEGYQQASKLGEIVEQSTLQVVQLEDQIGGLVTDYQQKKAQAEFDLDLAYKTNEKKFAEEYLQKNNLLAVGTADYSNLKNGYEDLQTNFETKVDAEVAKQKGYLTSQHQSEIKLKESEFKAKEAENVANIASLTAQLTASKAETAQAWKQLEAERTAAIERSKHGAIQGLTINGGTPGR